MEFTFRGIEAVQILESFCEQEFRMLRLISRFLNDESGATAIEYCLIAVGLSIVIITAVNGIGSTVNSKFSSINTSLK
jgi:pilus assembly protein Flp/PilA